MTAITKETGEYYFQLPGLSFDILCWLHSKKDTRSHFFRQLVAVFVRLEIVNSPLKIVFLKVQYCALCMLCSFAFLYVWFLCAYSAYVYLFLYPNHHMAKSCGSSKY